MLQLLSDSFMQSIVQNNLLSVRQYLRGGFDLNNNLNHKIHLPDKNTYLHWACMYANENVVRLLLENGADVNSVNKYGATPFHEAIIRKTNKEEVLRILETLLVFKSDAIHARGHSGAFKDLSGLELAHSRFSTDPEIYSFIRDFLSDISSLHSTISVPNSPTSPKQVSHSNSNGSLKNLTGGGEPNGSFHHHNSRHSLDQTFHNWFANDHLSSSDLSHKVHFVREESQKPLRSLLWPQPQSCIIISENDKDRFYLPNVKTQPLYIYFKPPHTYAYMDMVNKLASAFSNIMFYCIHKPLVNTPYISVTIDKNLFQHEHAYSIYVIHDRVDINACDAIGLQYAFFTFMQLSKIYARQSIPSLRVI
jgi:hypothetical protein